MSQFEIFQAWCLQCSKLHTNDSKHDNLGSRKIDQTIAFIFRIKDADFVRHEIDSVSPIFYK